MPVASELQVFGIQETLKEINNFDPSYRRQITKDIQSGAGNLIVTSARSLIPTDYPLTGMARGSIIKGRAETTFNINNVSSGVKTLVAKRGSKERSVTYTRPLYLDGSVVPGAYTQAPRALAPGIGAVMPEIEHEVSLILDRVSERMNKNLRIERRG